MLAPDDYAQLRELVLRRDRAGPIGARWCGASACA
jgi:hypothetical protein